MSLFLFMNIPFALSGAPTPVYDAVAEMFQLAERPDTPQDAIPLRTYFPQANAPLDMLPEWLRHNIATRTPSAEAVMLHGPGGDCATVAIQDHGLSCAWLSAAGDEVRFVARKDTRQKIGLSVAGTLVSVLREILCRRGVPLLHAAALRCPDDTGLLLQADGGGGKSTTALSLLRQGAHLLSDDLVAVTRDPHGMPWMTGFAEPMNLTAQTLAFFPELRPFATTPDVDRAATGAAPKARVNPVEAYAKGEWGARASLDACLFVQVDAAGPAVERLAPATVLGRLIQAHTFSCQQRLDSATAGKLLDIAEQVPAYLLRTGHDPAALGAWLLHNSGRLAGRSAGGPVDA